MFVINMALNKLLNREPSLQLNMFLNHGIQWMLEGKNYFAADILFTILCRFIDRMTNYMQSSNKMRVHAIYSSIMSAVTSSNCKQG